MTPVSDRAKDAVRSARLGWGLRTADRRELPQLLVVGAQRAGTTSLFQALRQHPGLMPPRFHKGLHYFDVNYSRGLEWYRAHFATSRHLDRIGASIGVRPVQFEVTPYYMFHPLAPQRFARDLPGAFVVAMLRNPVDRAYSAYAHEFARGYEDLSFDEAIAREPARLAEDSERLLTDPAYVSLAHRHQAYLGRGRYIEQLIAMESAVGRDRILVIDCGDFFARPDEAVAPLLDRLGLAPHPEMRFEVHNSRPRSRMSDSTAERLALYFEPLDKALADWWGRVPSWRR